MGISIDSNIKGTKAPVEFYELTAKANNGEMISFEKFRNKKVLLVNLASQCGYTPQYTELEKLNQLYKDKITILGFPSDDFGGQEPGNDDEIAAFCRTNFGVTFQLFHKDHVKGNTRQPVYQWLSEIEKNGWNQREPTWNFCKYLVDEKGDLDKTFSSSVSPLNKDLIKDLIT
ncbi:MAG: glutathione peroxidase [Chitinophagaceae bacterium]|nr:glutathione peroxidase [Chitinophagaceae bacterium]